MDDRQLQLFLAARSKTGKPPQDYYLVTDPTGAASLAIGFWNPATLGPAPTPAEVTTMRTAEFTLSSRQKDILAMIALIKRAQGIAAWNAMTIQQKKDATTAEADVWTTIRDFIEANL